MLWQALDYFESKSNVSPSLIKKWNHTFSEKELLEREGKMKNVDCGVEGEKGGREREREKGRNMCAQVLSDTGAGVHQRPCYNKDWVINNVHVVRRLNNACFQRC